jgi:predicted dehydrogenase
MSVPVRMAVVGAAGWRADFFLRLSRLLPDDVQLVGVVSRRPEAARQVSEKYGTVGFSSVSEMLDAARPDLVISSVAWEANPDVVVECVAAGAKVLCETPPAPDEEGLYRLWAQVGASRAVSVAEQYLLLPGHAARLAAIEAGLIGTPTSVQVSSTHNYHAVAMMRGYLNVHRGGPVRVTASTSTGPLVNPLDRNGWTEDDQTHPAVNVLAAIDFGDGAAGLYDFTDNQWHNQLRFRRIDIRGSHGEILDDKIIRLAGPRQIVRSEFLRSQLGYDLNLDGYDTEHISLDGKVLWRNPYLGARLMDEEIAITELLAQSAAWVRGETAEPYSLADASQDHLIGLAIDSAAETGKAITTEVAPWADALSH